MIVPLLASLALRVAILGGIAGTVCAIRRNGSASERHLVWMLAIGSMLLLPIATWLLPAIEIVALPASTPVISSVVIPESASPGLDWSLIVGLTWLAGALTALLRLAVAHARARSVVNRASYNERWSKALGRSVRVSAESPYAFNYGIHNPTVVLPATAVEWPDSLLRATLIHEAAHIARRDSVCLLVSELSRVMYWWHPMVWFAAREAAAERERACDDAVLRDGCRASDYGEHLLANGTQHVGPIALAGQLFSHTDGLARRISSLLDDRVDHRPIRRRAAFAAFAIGLPVVAITASAMPVTRPLNSAIESLTLGPVVAQAPKPRAAPAPPAVVSKKPKPNRRRKPETPTAVAEVASDALDKKLAEGTWIVDGRVVSAASFPVDLQAMARLAADMGRLAGKMTVTIDSAKPRVTR